MLPVKKQILIVSYSIVLYSGDKKEEQRKQNSPDVFGVGFFFAKVSMCYSSGLTADFTQLLPKSWLLSQLKLA